MILGSNQSYQELLQSFPPRLITSEEQFWATQDVIDALIDKGDLTPDEQEYLNLLGTLVYLYEEDSVEIPELRGVPLIKALLSERNLHQIDLVPILKRESIVHALFNGHHQLTTSEIENLSEFFSLPTDLFIEPMPAIRFPAFVRALGLTYTLYTDDKRRIGSTCHKETEYHSDKM